jgi:hypothetical protein
MSEWLDNAITYKRSLPLGAIYDDRFIFVHMHRLFDDFISVGTMPEPWLNELGLGDQSMTIHIPELARALGGKIAGSREFADMVKTMPKRKFVLYGPLDPPYPANPLTYIMNSPTIAHAYEHKRYFRDEFADLINIPPYEVRWLTDLTDASHDEFTEAFGKYVIQDVESSGSKGTFIVSSKDQYESALETLRKTSYSGSVVVSQFVEGDAYSVQVCVTKYGVFSGGLQRQLVDSKYLCNTTLKGVSRWCGGELGGKYPEIVKHRTQEIATVLGTELASHGYRGIFGIDLLINSDNEVYAIEINARLTGYTHILSDMQYAKQKIPFILLHTLELGNYKYEVNDLESLPGMASLRDKYSYLILNNQTDGDFVLEHGIPVGLYRYNQNERTIVHQKVSYSVEDIEDEEDILIFCKFQQGDVIGRGKRILKVVKKGGSMAEDADLDEPTRQLIEVIKQTFSIPG